MTETIRILVADDHTVVRKGLVTIIANEPGMAEELQPDVILLDLMMPRQDGLETIRQLKDRHSTARVLILTSFSEDDKVFPAIKAGALGYLLKDAMPEQLLKAIRDVHRGESSLHPTIALKLIRELSQPNDLPPSQDPLTEREVEVLKLVAQGFANQEIAAKLVISERTVGNHIGNILSKLHLANRTQAALYALREGLAPLNPPDES
jgi:NarL family two-component system response regulator LiaR